MKALLLHPSGIDANISDATDTLVPGYSERRLRPEYKRPYKDPFDIWVDDLPKKDICVEDPQVGRYARCGIISSDLLAYDVVRGQSDRDFYVSLRCADVLLRHIPLNAQDYYYKPVAGTFDKAKLVAMWDQIKIRSRYSHETPDLIRRYAKYSKESEQRELWVSSPRTAPCCFVEIYPPTVNNWNNFKDAEELPPQKRQSVYNNLLSRGSQYILYSHNPSQGLHRRGSSSAKYGEIAGWSALKQQTEEFGIISWNNNNIYLISDGLAADMQAIPDLRMVTGASFIEVSDWLNHRDLVKAGVIPSNYLHRL